ncbi:hypothetical protein SAMN05660971_03438 [Halomonas cupida]|uniref:Uncharacterized protein n=1 Tax=Halomonas cupida TaxID=44933 RepID=A0A1M7KCE3_9GAMM|nr:hypothetical protein SAMN05660971_03438 [Halomonas cupida]
MSGTSPFSGVASSGHNPWSLVADPALAHDSPPQHSPLKHSRLEHSLLEHSSLEHSSLKHSSLKQGTPS